MQTSKTRSPWIFGRALDTLLLVNFIWLIPVAATAIHFNFNKALLAITVVAFFFPFRDAHTFSPIFALFLSPEIRNYFLSQNNMLKKFGVALVLPVLVISASWCVPWHEIVGETGSYVNPVSLLAVVYAFLVYWHLSSQNYGLLRIYRAKVDSRRDSMRKSDFYFCHIIFLVFATIGLAFNEKNTAAILNQSLAFCNISFPLEGLLLGVGLSLGSVLIFQEWRTGFISVPRILFFSSASFLPVLLYENFFLSYIFVMTLNHILVEIALSSRLTKLGGLPWFKQKIFLTWVGLTFVIGILFYQIPLRREIVSRSISFDVYRMYGGSLTWSHFLTGCLVGLIYSIGLLHIFSDRFLYKQNSKNYPPKMRENLLWKA